MNKEISICCGVERSEIYPRDCWKCGALFVPKRATDEIEARIERYNWAKKNGLLNKLYPVITNIRNFLRND